MNGTKKGQTNQLGYSTSSPTQLFSSSPVRETNKRARDIKKGPEKSTFFFSDAFFAHVWGCS